jgi:porin
MWFKTRAILAALIFGFCFSSMAFAEEQKTTEKERPQQTTAKEEDTEQMTEGDAAQERDGEAAELPEDTPEGLLPIPEYGGDIGKREYLTGDWGGKRAEGADKGVQFDMQWMQWVGSVVDGGITDDTEYGGKLTFNLEFDLMRAGVLPGALLQIRAESRYCCTTLFNSGQVAPHNTAAIVPVNYEGLDSTEAIALTNFSYVQFLSEKVGLTIGKLDTFGDGDANEFATGRGMTQFMNWNFNFAPQTLTLPGSTLGGGVIYLPSHYLTISSLLLSGTDCSLGNCFDDLGSKGKIWVTTAAYQYRLGDKPGGFNAGFIYLFDKDFRDIDSISPLPPPPGTDEEIKGHSWQASISFWQYLSVKETSEGPLNLHNREADLRGWGLFGRVSFGDQDTNPYKSGVAIGLGGRGIFSKRPEDAFGVGYFYNNLSLPLFLETIGVDDSAQGVEAFYNWAITPAAKLTFDVQWLESALDHVDDSTVLTARLLMTF